MIPPGQECGTCDGLGKVRERKTQSVAVPAGSFLCLLELALLPVSRPSKLIISSRPFALRLYRS